MSERIKELAEQAGLTDYMVFGRIESKEDVIKKFAELIVIECASICYNSGLKDPDAHAMNLMFDFNIDNCRNDK